MLQIKQTNAGSRAEWLVEHRYTFGSGSENDYKVSGADVKSAQAGLEVNGDEITLFNLGGGASVKVNDETLAKSCLLKAGDHFSVGGATFSIEDPKKGRSRGPMVNPSLSGWALKAKNTALANKSFPLDGVQVLGRAKECDICLNVVHLSRQHAKVTVQEDHLQLDDLGSSNGTYINGKKVQVGKARAGDEVAFDTLRFIVHGPRSQFESTNMRHSHDNDATTLRPALSEADLKRATPKPKSSSRRAPNEQAKPKAHAQGAPTAPVKTPYSAQTPTEEPSNSKTGLIVSMVIGIALLGAAVYFFAPRV